MHFGHRIIRCRFCDKLIETCRCMSKDKPLQYETCSLCAATHGQEPSTNKAATSSEDSGK